MEGHPAISIIVPVYNTGIYLKRCLDSIINQTFRDIEIICVNDGSTDNSAFILKNYAELDPRIQILTKENGGLSSARNAGLECARADYIGFVDSDDYIAPEMYEKLFTKMTQNDVDLAHCGTQIIYENTVADSIKDSTKEDTAEYYRIKYAGVVRREDELFATTDVAAWNKLYKKEIIDAFEIRFPEKLYYEDSCFSWCYMSVSKKICYIPDAYYQYIKRPGSIMDVTLKKEIGRRVLDHLRNAELFYRFLATQGLFDAQKYAFWNCYLIAVNCTYALATLPVLRDWGVPEIKQLLKDKDVSCLNKKKYALLHQITASDLNYIYHKKITVLFGIITAEAAKDMFDFSKKIQICNMQLPDWLTTWVFWVYSRVCGGNRAKND
jgi:glycosyltransferase involved in cell wall biosynthesis